MDNQLIKIDFNKEQVALIKSQIAPKATDAELQLFLYQARRTGLDPLTRQIYAIHRRQKVGDNWVDKMTIQTSIDGFRVIAERSGDYGGQDEPIFEESADGSIIKATVKVYKFRGEQRYCAAVGVAYWSEYVQADRDGKPTGMWSKMPHAMLAKVAEALALRKAYPQDLSGLYTADEMNQSENVNSSHVQDIPHEEVKDSTPPININSGDAKKDEGNHTMTRQGAKPWLNPGTAAWNNAFAKIHTGQITMDDVMANYRISKANHENLLNSKYEYHANGTSTAVASK